MKKPIKITALVCAAAACSIGSSACTSDFYFGKTVTLSYELGGVSEPQDPHKGNKGSSFRLPNVEDAKGYAFVGWYFDEFFLEKCGTTITLDRNRTLHAKWTIEDEDWTYSPILEDTAFKVISYRGNNPYVKIEPSCNGKPVSAVGAKFLGDRAKKTHGIFIPDSIKKIEDYAFYNTQYLEELTIPASVTSLGNHILDLDSKSWVPGVDGIMRKYLFVNGNPDVKENTLMDAAGSFRFASVVARPNSNIYAQYQRRYSNSVGKDTVDSTGIKSEPLSTPQYAAHPGKGSEHETAYDVLKADEAKVLPAINAGQLLHNLRFGYASTFVKNPITGKETMAERVYNKARAVLDKIINNEMDEYQKIHAIYDWVTTRNTYDHSLTINNPYSPGTPEYTKEQQKIGEELSKNWLHASFNLEGVFLNGTAVCDGLSKSIELLCRMEGIECYRIIGAARQNGNRVGHAWNKIKLKKDDKWYLLDSTWGDAGLSNLSELSNLTGQEKPEFTNHEYMLTVGDERTHQPDPPFQEGFDSEQQDTGNLSNPAKVPLYFDKEYNGEADLTFASGWADDFSKLLEQKAVKESLEVGEAINIYYTGNWDLGAVLRQLDGIKYRYNIFKFLYLKEMHSVWIVPNNLKAASFNTSKSPDKGTYQPPDSDAA